MALKKISFLVDKILFRTRASDDTYIVTLETGEYEKNNIAELMKLTGLHNYKVTIEVLDS